MNEEYILPKLFFSNLMYFCEMNSTQLYEKINDEVKYDIECYIYKLSKLVNTNSKPGMSIFTPSFIKEYELLLNKLGSSKKQDYCLFRKFYENLRNLLQCIDHKKEKVVYRPVILNGKTYSDKEFLKMYKELYMQYEEDLSEAISPKQLNRLLEPHGKMYANTSKKIVNYTICHVFAPLFIDKIDKLSVIIDNDDYLKLFIFDGKTNTQKILITEEKEVEVKNVLKNILNDLIETVEDEEKFGKKFIQLFENLIDLYYSENVFINIATESSSRVSKNTDSFCSYEEDNDALISSCIVKFINWLPVCGNNSTADFMDAVTDVIDVIREPLKKSLDYNSLNKGDLFLLNRNIAQRKILVEALYNNDYFSNKFIGYYKKIEFKR